MSDADHGPVTVSEHGITIKKTLEQERFPTLAVVIELTSERDTIARIRVVEQVPDDIPDDDVGFHPNYGEDYWSMTNGNITFERNFEPGETYTTIYGFRDYPEDRLAELLNEPEVSVVDTRDDRTNADQTEERSGGNHDFLTEEEDTSGREESSEAHTDDSETGVEVDEGGEQIQANEVDSSDAREPPSGGVVRVLIEELREESVNPKERQKLRDELQDIEGTPEARVNKLQEQVSDFEAYIAALEEFLDEEGTVEEIFEGLETEIANVEEDVGTVTDQVDAAVERVESVEDRIRDEAIEDRINELKDEIDAAESRVEGLVDRSEDNEDEIDDIDSRLNDFVDDIDRISDDVGNVDNQIDDVEEHVNNLQDEFEVLRQDIQDDIDTLEEDLEAFDELRDRIATVFGDTSEGIEPAEGEGEEE